MGASFTIIFPLFIGPLGVHPPLTHRLPFFPVVTCQDVEGGHVDSKWAIRWDHLGHLCLKEVKGDRSLYGWKTSWPMFVANFFEFWAILRPYLKKEPFVFGRCLCFIRRFFLHLPGVRISGKCLSLKEQKTLPVDLSCSLEGSSPSLIDLAVGGQNLSCLDLFGTFLGDENARPSCSW